MKEGLRVQNGPAPGGLYLKHIKYIKNIEKSSRQNRSAQMREIWYVALPSCPSPSLFKWRSRVQTDPVPGCPGFEP